MTPEMLEQSGWLKLVGGVIHRSFTSTCKGREIDFWVSSIGIGSAVMGTSRVSNGGFTPHSPTRLYLQRSTGALMEKRLVEPRKIEADLPFGPAGDDADSMDMLASEVHSF